MNKLLFALAAIVILSGCSIFKNQQSSKEIQNAINAAEAIVKRIDSVANLPIVPKVVDMTPNGLDNETLAKIQQYISVVLPYFSELKVCYNDDLNVMLLCVATNFRNIPEDKRELLLMQLKIIIAISQSKQ